MVKCKLILIWHIVLDLTKLALCVITYLLLFIVGVKFLNVELSTFRCNGTCQRSGNLLFKLSFFVLASRDRVASRFSNYNLQAGVYANHGQRKIRQSLYSIDFRYKKSDQQQLSVLLLYPQPEMEQIQLDKVKFNIYSSPTNNKNFNKYMITCSLDLW